MFCPVMKPALAPQRTRKPAEFLGVAEAPGGIELGPFRQQLVDGNAALLRVHLRDRAAQAVGVEGARHRALIVTLLITVLRAMPATKP